MSDGLRVAAQRILDGDCNGRDGLEDDAVWVAQAYLAAPAWHKRPTGPGRWVCDPDGTQVFRSTTVLDLNQEDLERGAPFHTKAVFGPIPQCDA